MHVYLPLVPGLVKILPFRHSVQDKTIGTSIPVLDLIDAIQPQSVNFELVKTGSLSDEDKLDNAK